MILTSMTYKEMYDHLAANLPKIQFKMNMLFSTLSNNCSYSFTSRNNQLLMII